MKQITENDFKIFPAEVTELPVFDSEDGEIFGWGHIGWEDLANAAPAINEYYGLSEEESVYSNLDTDAVQYRYAVTLAYSEGDDYTFKFCSSSEPGAFPVTYVPGF